MSALATSADVEAVLGRSLSVEESERVEAALAKASAFVRADTGRRFEAGEVQVRRRARGGRILLDDPESVESVTAVSACGDVAEVTGFTFRAPYLYGLADGWYEVGYTAAGSVPDDVAAVVASMAARNVTNTAPEGVQSYSDTRGPFTESATFAEPTDSISATPTELATIRRHVLRVGGPVNML